MTKAIPPEHPAIKHLRAVVAPGVSHSVGGGAPNYGSLSGDVAAARTYLSEYDAAVSAGGDPEEVGAQKSPGESS